MTSDPNPYTQGDIYLIDVGGEEYLRAMRADNGSLPWAAEDGSLYADELTTVVRRLVVIDPDEELTAGYVEIDGRGWVPLADSEKAAAQVTAAADRLAALTKAAEFTRFDGTAPFKLSQSPEHAQTRRVIEAAKWVLTGE